jgi:aspartate/methionine/tyrosine aminotransferase
MSAEKQQALIDLARQHNLIVFSDEVYRGLEHQPGATLPAACDLYENALSLGVLSKTYGLAGLRIGWMATHNRALLDTMATFKDYTSMCNSAPSEFLGIVALRHRQAIAERNRNIIRTNLDRLDKFFAAYADLFDWQRPRAGSTAFPRIKFKGGAEAFCNDLVNQHGVLLLPSTCYDFGDEHVRVGYGRKNLPEALASLEAYVAGRFRK